MGSKAGQVQTTPAQAALADHALSQLNDYRQRWLPVQMKLASTIEQEGKADSAERKLATGKGSTDVATEFGKAQGAVNKALANAGVAPGSPRATLATTGMGADYAGSTGLSHLMGEQAIDDAYTQGLGALMTEGRGQAAQVGQNMSTQAAASAAQARADAEASMTQREAEGGAIGTAAGFGLQQAMRSPSGTRQPVQQPSLSSDFGSPASLERAGLGGGASFANPFGNGGPMGIGVVG